MNAILAYFENNPGTGLVVGVAAIGATWIGLSVLAAWALGKGGHDRGRPR